MKTYFNRILKDSKEIVVPGNVYKHYKGGIYKVIGVAMHTEQMYPIVVYRNINEQQLWARPYNMFIDYTDTNLKRFELLKNNKKNNV